MTSSPASPAARSRRRVLLITSLVVGTAGSLALLFAASWVPLLAVAAVAVALAGGFLATWAALVEFREWRERTAAEATQARAAERERTQALHATQRRVLADVDVRTQRMRATLDQTAIALGESKQTISRLRGDNEGLRFENRALRTENDRLRAQLESLAAEQRAGEAQVVELPRRRTAVGSEWDAVDAPTVIDLDLQRLVTPFVAEMRRAHAI